MLMWDETHDPFLTARDPGEERVDGLMREFLLREKMPERVYRQGGIDGGYALIVPRLSGEAVLTVPGLHEADFMYHGNPGCSASDLAEYIEEAILDSGADHLRIPLLSAQQARTLEEALVPRLSDWTLNSGLSSVIPLMSPAPGGKRIRSSLQRALARVRHAGLTVEIPVRFPTTELLELHRSRWGPNRGEGHFRMLETLVEEGCAELATARTADGTLVAAQIDLLGAHIRHSYYAASAPDRARGCGTAVLGAHCERFAEESGLCAYSFGRGSERYKYQYANGFREVYELKGFYTPSTCFHCGSAKRLLPIETN